MLSNCDIFATERTRLLCELEKIRPQIRHLDNDSLCLYLLTCEGDEIVLVVKFIFMALSKKRSVPLVSTLALPICT